MEATNMRKAVTGLVLAGMLLAGGVVAQQKKQQEIDLQAAMRSETVDGDLKGAIKQYGAIVAKYTKDRAVSAMALVHMAECYQKMGDSESQKIYERVLRDFADQKEAAGMARARLGRAGSVAGGKGDRPVWTGPEVDIFGRISPDGRYLSYVDWDGTGNLMAHDMLTGTNHSLTKKKSWDDGNGQASWSSISRDGKQIAYEWFGGSRYDLLLASFHGSSIGEPRSLVSNDDISSARPFEWSPDGKWIAVLVERTDRSSQIGLVSVADGSLRVLRSVAWRGPTNMAFSRDGAFVAYDLPQSDGANKRDVFVLALDGSRGGTLVANGADDTLVGFSGDGQLLFASDRAGSIALWAQRFADGKTHGAPVNIKPDFGAPWIQGMTAAGVLYVTKRVSDSDVYFAPVDLGAGKLLAAPVGVQSFPGRGRPDWSADGKSLTFIDCQAFGGERCTISTRNIETGQSRELRPALHYVAFPRWSPDGRSFLTNGTDLKGRSGIFLIDAATGETSRVVEGGTQLAGWSADGKSFFFVRSRKLVERELASGRERELLPVPAKCGRMTVSPDAAFAACISGESALVVVPLNGGEPRELFRAQQPESMVGPVVLSWTLHGRALVVTKRLMSGSRYLGGSRELWLVPVTGEVPRKLDIDASSWNILGGIGAPFSPDGKQVAFMAGKDSAETWALEGFLPAKSASR
jgi:Tol biopolymer transport system component